MRLSAGQRPGRADLQQGGALGREQIAWARQILTKCKSARWTFVILHRPLWDYDNGNQNGWIEIERQLDGRNYTVFAGHEHRYRRFVRRGMNYYQLATTGGSSELRGIKHGEIDHFAWVTMKRPGPVIANVKLDGVLSDTFVTD